MDYVPIDDREVSDVDNELDVEEELTDHEDIKEAGCDGVVEQDLNVSIPASGVRRLLGELTMVKEWY